MPNFRVEWKSGPATLLVDIFDPALWLNTYKFSDPNAIVPAEGEYLNQFQHLSPTVAGWIMLNYDNKKDYPIGHEGAGKVDMTADGTFPKGDFVWTIIEKLA